MGFDEENPKVPGVAAYNAGPATTLSDDTGEKVRTGSVQEYNSITVVQDGGVLSQLRNLETALDRKLGVEAEAINRVRAEDKTPQNWRSQATMALIWASGTLQIPTVATGFLGPEFGLSLGQSIAVVVAGNLFGGAVTGFCAMMGPGTGLRQISISRYSFGWYPSKLIALLNTISQVGWSVLTCVTNGSVLTAVSNGRVSSALAVVIIAVASLVVSFVGLRAVLKFDKYVWVVAFVIILVLYGEGARFANPALPAASSGATHSAAALSFLAITYGSSGPWCTIGADYYVHFPADTSKLKVFVLTTLGVCVPTCLGEILGCCLASALTVRPDWDDIYRTQGLGWLLQEILHPVGFAKFALVLFILSGMGQITMAMYSAGLSIQQFARPIAVVPRFFWTLLVFGAIIGLALAGKDQLFTVLQNLLALLGYWNTCFFFIVFAEHVVFRKSKISNYQLESWNDPAKMPIGIAGMTAFLIGFVGWFLGMVTTWFVGPLARLIGEDGGDIGNELALVLTLVSYIPARWLELKYIGR